MRQLACVLDAVAAPQSRETTEQGTSIRAAQLNELYLQNNRIGDATALLSAAAKLRGLTWLNLSANPGVGDTAFAHLAEILERDQKSFKRLREVRLLETGAGSAATNRLAKACAARKIALAAPGVR